MLTYALYARKSHDDTDVTQKSLTDQVQIWRDLAPERGYTIAYEYEESKSAQHAGVRPLFDDMIQRIRRGEINGILVWHVNRLARNMAEGGLLADLLIDGHIQEIRTPTEVFRQQDNILPLVLQQATATQNNRDHAAAVRRGVKSRFESGGWTHRAPVGYLNRRDERNPRQGILVRDPERFALLRRAWEKLLNGVYSVEEVIALLNDEWGFRTRQTKKRGGAPLTRSHGYKIFTSVFYAGYVVREGQMQRGVHEPMVSIREFHAVQEILRARRKPRSRRRQQFAFAGLLRCGLCGQQVTAGLHRKGNKSHLYYHCSDSYRRCTKRGISESRINAQVMALLDSITLDPQLCQLAQQKLLHWLEEETGDSERDFGQLHRSLESVEGQLNNLLGLRLREVITDDGLYRQKEAELVAERNRLRLALQQAQEEMEGIRQNARRGYDYLAFARNHYLIADLETRKELARAMGLEFVLRGNELSITLSPLLKEMVAFAEGIIVSFEPGLEGSQSRYRASLIHQKSFGRGEGTLFEPGAHLQRELKSRPFPEFKWPVLADTLQAGSVAATGVAA